MLTTLKGLIVQRFANDLNTIRSRSRSCVPQARNGFGM